MALASACEETAPQARTSQPAGTGRFVDNGDGSVTDRTTGLVWEQKCDCPESLHDYEGKYWWSADGAHETIWDWIAKVNAEGEGGLAGHADWRVPNVKELLSLVNYERYDPAVSPELDSCDRPCDEAFGDGCVCTMAATYWTSTTFADFPAHALLVDFVNGSLDDQLKTRRSHVRAVRGPLPDSRAPLPGSPGPLPGSPGPLPGSPGPLPGSKGDPPSNP